MAEHTPKYQVDAQLQDEAIVQPKTSSLLDPYTRGLITYGMREGKPLPIDWRGEEQRRIETLKEAVVPSAEIMMGRGMTEAQRLYQRAGKLTSSAAPVGVARVAEQFGVQVAGEISRGVGEIYRDIGAERLGYAGLGTQLTMADIQATTARDVAGINAATDKAIAVINANVTLTGYDKQIEIAKINAEADKAIADTRYQEAIDVEGMRGTTAITLQANEFDWKTNPTTGNPWTWDEFTAALAQNKVQFDLTQTADSKMFWESIKQAREMFNLKDWQIRDLAKAQLEEAGRQFDLSRMDDMHKWGKEMELARKYFDTDKEFKTWQMNSVDRALNEQIREFDLTLEQSSTQFNDSLEWAKVEFGLTDTRIRELQSDYLHEQSRQFDLTNNAAVREFQVLFDRTTRDFNLNRADRFREFKEVMEIQREQVQNESLRTFIGLGLQILNDPFISEFLAGAESDIAADIISGIFSSLIDAGFTTDFENMSQGDKDRIQDIIDKAKLLAGDTDGDKDTGVRGTAISFDVWFGYGWDAKYDFLIKSGVDVTKELELRGLSLEDIEDTNVGRLYYEGIAKKHNLIYTPK